MENARTDLTDLKVDTNKKHKIDSLLLIEEIRGRTELSGEAQRPIKDVFMLFNCRFIR